MIRHLIRFHWRSGARVALRANGVVGAAIMFVFALDMDALARVRISTLELVARHAGWGARWELAAISVALAALAMPRVTLGVTGWMRSLPISATAGRRAAVAALCSVQLFTVVVATLAVFAVPLVYHARLDLAKIASLPLIYVAAAVLVLPVESAAGRIMAVIALGLAVPGKWLFSAAAVAALILADRFSGRIVPFRRRVARASRRGIAHGSPVAQWMRFTLRTLPRATIASCLLLPGAFTVFTALIILHNPDIDLATATRTIRIGGMLALIAFAGALASSIVRARPPWPWSRSLPWSSRQRVTGDSMILVIALIAVPLYLASLDWRSGLVLLMVVPALAATAASAIRAGARQQTSAAGEITMFGVLFGTAIALWPWTAAIIGAATPLFFAWAVRRDRRLVTTRWEELHHDATGDPSWMSIS